MIIGTDLLTELAMDQRFSNQIVVWDNLTAPVRTGKNQDEELLLAYVLAIEVPILKLAKEQQNRILDANCEAVDLDDKINVMDSLSEYQKKQLIKPLKKLATLSNRGLRTIDIKQIHLEIKGGVIPEHFKPCPIPKGFESSRRKNVRDSVE